MSTTADGAFARRRVIVTGAGRGIGLAIARAFAEAGAEVVAVSRRSTDEIEGLVSTTATTFLALDLASPDAATALAAAAGPVDVLVNNVGLATARPSGFLSITDDEWMTSFTLNFLSAMRTTRAVLPGMLGRPGANIVNIASVNAELPDPAVIDYSAAKAALASFGKSLSQEYGGRIRVNWINPGPVATDLWLGHGGIAETFSAAGAGAPQEVADAAVAGTATKRFSRPEEVAAIALFLAGDAATNITGTGIRIDGGLVATL
ncbi:MAG: SDR family oxidoreductase [Pseudolysinimonas sp.]